VFAAYLPPGSRDGVVVLDLPEDATVSDVMRRLGIPADSTRVVLVNGHDAAPEQSLAPDDVVAVFPPLAGGGLGGTCADYSPRGRGYHKSGYRFQTSDIRAGFARMGWSGVIYTRHG